MKIPLSWLKDYIDIEAPAAQLAKLLTSLGLEVDAVENVAIGFDNVVVGRVETAVKHPDADKLILATVSDGAQTYQIVCGAPNCRPGIKTAFARVGAKLKDASGKTFSVKPAKIRGIESFGMLCSTFDLGLSDSHDDIIEFAEQVQVGEDVASMYADTLFEISLTPNLNHCSSLVGVARELSPALKQPYRIPAIALTEEAQDAIEKSVKVTVADPERCPRYLCRLVRGVKVGPSPDWMKARLEASGLRSVNNIVDITNYVLLELGQPLHAFDFDKLEGGAIVVRHAADKEPFTTLDEKTRSLAADDLLICDAKKPVAIAGVMGGGNSEVSHDTVNVLIESAYFAPSTVRRTSKRLGLLTDSSKRFERGIDPNGLRLALDRAAMLMQQLGGGKIAKGVVEVSSKEFLPKQITCRLARINAILGTKLGLNEVEEIFRDLQFPCRWNGQDAFEVSVPTYRVDIGEEIDLVEEVARFYGYDNIPKVAAAYRGTMLPHAPIYLFEKQMRSALVAQGLQEFLTCDLIGPWLLNKVYDTPKDNPAWVKVLNPTSVEQSILRTSLLPGLLQVVKYNRDHQNEDIAGFEIGRIHFKQEDNYKEQSLAGIILTGKARPHHWERKPAEVDFYDLKGVVETLFDEIGIAKFELKPGNNPIFHTGRQAAIYINGLEVGSLGELHPSLLRRLDISRRVYFAEINLHDLFQFRTTDRRMAEIPQFPGSDRDWTVTMPEAMPVEKVLQIVDAFSSPLLRSVDMKDLYRGEKVGEGKKNVTFHFSYLDRAKTLEQDAVDTEHNRIVAEIKKLLEIG